MTLIYERSDDERVLPFEQSAMQSLTEPRASPRPPQKLRWPPPQTEVLTTFVSQVAFYLTGAIFLIGIAAAFYFVVGASEDFPVSFMSQARGPVVDAFVLGRDNLAMLVFDLTIMAASICFIFVLPDLYSRSRQYLETPLISPSHACKIRWGNYGGVAGIMVGLGGMFASRFAPAFSGMRFVYPQAMVTLGFAPPITWIFVGPLDIAFLGFAGCALFYGMLGLAGVSFVSRKVAKGMVTAGFITSIITSVIILVPIPEVIVTCLHWGLFLGTVAWMVPFNQSYTKSWKNTVPENAKLADVDANIQKTLWVLGITSQEQLAWEDSRELGAILGVPASQVDQWKGMKLPVITPENPPTLVIKTENAIKAPI